MVDRRRNRHARHRRRRALLDNRGAVVSPYSDPEKFKKYHQDYYRKYRKDHPDYWRKVMRRWRAKHLDRSRANSRRWQAAHRESARVTKSRRRARKRLAPNTLTSSEWTRILAAHKGRCHYCGAPAEHMEHILPLARGGGTTFENVVPACAPCNLSKNSRHDWPPNVPIHTCNAETCINVRARL
jgi:hypothetical protein